MMRASKFSQMNKEEKLNARKEAYNKWMLIKAGKTTPVNLSIIAKDVGMSLNELEEYMIRDKWEKRLLRDKKAGKLGKQIQKEVQNLKEQERVKDSEVNEVQGILDSVDMSERWKMFILYYLQCYNAKQAAIKAGYSKQSAHVAAMDILKQERVKDVLTRIKRVISRSLYIEAHDIISEYAKIAFSDITDYVEFEGNQLTLKNSNQVDGTIITEIKQGRDGLSVKLLDRMKALEKLERLLDVIPDRKLELDREKFEFTKKLADKTAGEGGTVTIINDIG